MVRIAIATLLMIATCGVTTAQRRHEPSLHTELRDGQWVWKLDARGSVSLNDLLRHYAQARDVVILYNEKKLTGHCDWCGAAELTGTQIDLFVANVLDGYRMLLAHRGGRQYVIAFAGDVESWVPLLTRAELETANPATWAVVPVQMRNFIWHRPRPGAVNQTTPEADRLPYHHNGIVICDRVDRLANWLRMLDELDAAAAREVRAYELPEGVTATEAVRMLRELLSAAHTFTASPGGTQVLCRARPQQHVHVAEAIAALK